MDETLAIELTRKDFHYISLALRTAIDKEHERLAPIYEEFWRACNEKGKDTAQINALYDSIEEQEKTLDSYMEAKKKINDARREFYK